MPSDFFPPRPDARPAIYAYEDSNPLYVGLLKVGYTSRDVEGRVAQQYPTAKPGERPYRIVFSESAVRPDGTSFTDHDVHRKLESMGFKRKRDRDDRLTEWFCCTVDNVRAAWIAVRDRTSNDERRTLDFAMRPEQEAAVAKTQAYFVSVSAEGSHRTPKFLWNAKMRFGKTFATYQLARRMGFTRVLVLTFKPAVKTAWQEDLQSHVDFEGWQFVQRDGMSYEEADPSRPIVCFGSFQDFLGRDQKTGQVKPRNRWVHEEDWDLVVFDEYHFGAWNENSKTLFAKQDENEDELNTSEEPLDTRLGRANTGNPDFDEGDLPIVTRYYLFLSGTPFRALTSGEFIEEQVYNWTYSDEQAAKEAWPGEHPGQPNPYESLPRMVMLTYKMPDEVRSIAMGGEFNSFDLNAFFEAKGEGADAQFVFKDHVQKWLDLIRGAHLPAAQDDLKLGADRRPPMPYADTRLLGVLNHTVWYLPRVNSCYAMRNLLAERQNTFFHDYAVNVCAGVEAGVGAAALDRVQESMADPLNSKTITLTCGKLTTGVTVKPWCGIFMLSNMRSPETYFQAAFRVQSPWVVHGENGRREIVKRECYVFDFSLDRALRMVSNYSLRLSVDETGPEQKVGEFINFLPVLAYDGSTMRQVNAGEILDIAMAGTSATLLARRWESALLVNVDNDTLRRIIDNEDAMRAIMSIEGFRALGSDVLETIVNKSEGLKKAKREKGDELTPKEKRELSDEERELKSKRKQVQEKLIKFATRIPVFMYLTDYREECLKDVITQLEPGLFKKVTGLSVEDFNLLVSLGVFNDGLMNDAVYKFRRYEDASLSYTGIDRHAGEKVGLFDTSLSEFDYLQMRQEESMRSGLVGERGDVRVAGTRGAQVAAGARAAASAQVAAPARGGAAAQLATAAQFPAAAASVQVGVPTRAAASAQVATPAASSTPAQPTAPAPYPAAEAALEQKRLQERAASLDAGDTVFHKAFGYGEICRFEAGVVVVRFEGERKERKFLFPGIFLQKLLRFVD